MRWRFLARASAVAAMAAVTSAMLLHCKAEVLVPVDLEFGVPSDAGVGGFACTETDGRPLMARAKASGSFALYVDLLAFSAFPGCRTAELTAWCGAHPADCKPIERKCFDVPLNGASDPAQVQAAAKATLEDAGVVFEETSSEPRSVRVVGVAGTCPSGVLRPDDPLPTALVGCAYSCPVALPTTNETNAVA